MSIMESSDISEEQAVLLVAPTDEKISLLSIIDILLAEGDPNNSVW